MKLFSTHFRILCLAVAGLFFSGMSATKALAQNPPCQTPEATVAVTCCSNDMPYNYNGHVFNQGGTYDVHLTNAQGCDSLVHLNLTVLEGAYAYISGNVEICPGASTQLSANGNGTPKWSTGATGSPITVTAPGLYILTVTAPNGCKAYDTVAVTLLPQPNVAISGPDSICSGSSALLIASGGYSYSWNTGSSEAAINVSPAQTTSYVVTARSDRNCTATAVHAVRVNPLPTPAITGNDVICEGAYSIFTATGGNSYQWSTGATSASIQVAVEQLYSVQVTNQYGCTASASKFLTVNDLPTVSIIGRTYICEGGSTVLNATGIGGVSYVWNNMAIGQSYSVSSPGIYTVVVTSAANCTASATVSVTQKSNPVVTVSGNLSFCDGLSTQLTASGGQSYLWRNAYGTQISSSSTVTLVEGGPYMVIATDSNGCSTSQQINVTKKNNPNVMIAPSANEVCDGTPVTLSSALYTGYSYLWNTGSHERQITVTSAGTYTLQVTANGCTSVDSLEVVMYPLPEIYFSGNLAVCRGQSATIYAQSPNAVSYLWNTGAQTNSIHVTPQESTAFSVTVEDNHGCVNQDAIYLMVEEYPTATITGPDGMCRGSSIELIARGAIRCLWNDGETDAQRRITQAGTYSVVVSTFAGCSATAEKTVVYYDTPEISITGGPLVCIGDTILLVAHGGATYQWSNQSTDSCMAVTTAGTYMVQGWSAEGCTSRDTLTIGMVPKPEVQIVGNHSACAGGLNMLTAQSATAISYLWNTGATSTQIRANETGVFTVTVSDSNACKASDSFAFELLPIPECAIIGPDRICVGETATLSASNPNYHYFWSTGSTNSSITVSPTTTTSYSLVVLGDNNCTANISKQLEVRNYLPIPISGNDSFCEGDSVVLVAQGDGGFIWSNGQVGNSIVIGEGGDYAVSSLDSTTCFLSSSKHVDKYALPEVYIEGAPHLCVGNTGTLRAVSDMPVSYLWSTGATDSVISVSSTNVYGVTVTSAHGCSNSSSKMVVVHSAPSVNIVGPNTACYGQAVELMAVGSATHFLWPSGDTTANTVVNPMFSTTYNVVGYNEYGCTATAGWYISVLPVPMVSISGDTLLCEGDTTVLTCSTANAYIWSTGETSKSIRVGESGVYTVVVTNTMGCTNSASLNVHVDSYPAIVISGDTILCQGQQSMLYAYGGASYLWDDGTTSPYRMIAPVADTSYTVQVSNGLCASTATQNIHVNERPVAQIEAPDGLCEGSTVSLIAHGGLVYFWSTGQTSAMIDVSTVGTYQLVAYNQYGCTDTTSHTLIQYSNPQVSIMGAEAICEGSQAQLSAVGDGLLLWSTGDTNANITIHQVGYYQVLLTDHNGCTSTASRYVSALAMPNITIFGPTNVCGEETINLSVACTNTASYQWNTGATTSSIEVTPSETTTYSVVAVSPDNCTAVQTYTVEVHPEYALDFEASICQGNSYTGQGFVIPVQDEAGEFTFTETYTSVHGCDSVRTLYLTVTAIPVIVNPISGNSTISSPGNYVYTIGSVEGASSYEWILSNPNWALSYNQNIAQITVLVPGSATLSVYAINECGQSQPTSMQVTYSTGINDVDGYSVTVYPNPTTDMVNVQLTMNNEQLFGGEIQLLDMYGKLLNRWEMNGNDMQLDLSSYAAGVYMLKLRNNQNSTESVVKVVKH